MRTLAISLAVQQPCGVHGNEFARECGRQPTFTVTGLPRLRGLERHRTLKASWDGHELRRLRRCGRVVGVVRVFQVQESPKGWISFVAEGPDNPARVEDVEVRLPKGSCCGHAVRLRDGEQVDVAPPVIGSDQGHRIQSFAAQVEGEAVVDQLVEHLVNRVGPAVPDRQAVHRGQQAHRDHRGSRWNGQPATARSGGGPRRGRCVHEIVTRHDGGR